MQIIDWIDKYIEEMGRAKRHYKITEFKDCSGIYSVIKRGTKVLGNTIPLNDSDFSWRDDNAIEDADIFIDKLEFYRDGNIEDCKKKQGESKNNTLIFISHRSSDKKYGDALRDFIIGLGVEEERLIYTSHPLHKIPLDAPIYDYLRAHINEQVFMIILWSDEYLNSPACLNEMGAAWVVQSDYTNMYVPNFSFGNPKYHECAVDTRKMGAILNGDVNCRMAMIEFKNKILNMFDLEIDDSKAIFLLEEFIKAITN